MSPLLFSTIEVTRQAFYRSSLSYAIVNIKPIVPGHVLVIPNRVVPRLSDLNSDEVQSLFSSVQLVGSVIEKVFKASALTIACQDGKDAGQSVPHVHVHILPRGYQDDPFRRRNDDVYPELEHFEADLGPSLSSVDSQSELESGSSSYQPLKMDAGEARRPRAIDEMIREAEWLKKHFDTP